MDALPLNRSPALSRSFTFWTELLTKAPFAGQVVSRGRPDIVAYWQHEKKDYALWELLLYMGQHTVPQTLAYFDLPADTVPFWPWVYNHVAHEQREQVQEMAQGFFGAGLDLMTFLPYPELYALW